MSQPQHAALLDALEALYVAANAASTHPLDALETLAEIKSVTTSVVTWQTVQEARAAGSTWAEIGTALGTSRQAAQERYGDAPST
jgi:hypothetical protein